MGSLSTRTTRSARLAACCPSTPNLRAWPAQVLAYLDKDRVSNGGAEAINLIVEETRRLAPGFRTFARNGPHILLAVFGTDPCGPPTPDSEEPES